MSIQRPTTSVVWDEDSGEVVELSVDQRLHMVVEGVIVWCDHHQCFHWINCSATMLSRQVH